MAKVCLKCSLPATRSTVIGGKYYSRLCTVHFGQLKRGQMPSSGEAEYNRSRDFEEHMSDVVQPYDKGGNPSRDFIALYRDRAVDMWGEDTVRKFEL